ncbi:MAG TPA: SPW repeat protein [Anaerolineae bacterium]
MNWLVFLSGIVLFFAPFALGFSGNPLALWTCMIMSAILAVLGFIKS